MAHDEMDIHWEIVIPRVLRRIEVPGGWIYEATGILVGMAFVPDPPGKDDK